MEGTDKEIVSLLANDGRMSYTDIAKATGLSTSAAHQRVRRLEERGVITGYRATVSPDALGRTLLAFLALTPIDPRHADDIPRLVAELPEVEDCYAVAGDASYVLKVRVPTPEALADLQSHVQATANVASVSTIVLSTYFEDRQSELAVPMASELA